MIALRLIGVAVALLVTGCPPPASTEEPLEMEFVLADPDCLPYVALPGTPCKKGTYLDVDEFAHRRPPRDTLCSCYMREVKK